MSCAKSKNSNEDNKEYQDLNGWTTPPSLDTLVTRISANAKSLKSPVRIYTVASTRLEKNNSIEKIRHEGSGPNLEGGLATLCTCKRSMRQGRPIEYWENSWVLGLTSRARSNGFSGQHYLLYFMKIEKAVLSHKELFYYLQGKYPSALEKKSAVTNPLGDVYIPERSCSDALNPAEYEKPHKYHSHGCLPGEEWEQDISLRTRDGRVGTPMLIGDPQNTYVWREPVVHFKGDRNSGSKTLSMEQLLFGGYLVD